ncbi:MAG: nucleotidyltransferase domain-containing protein [Pseudomonadales bacterium]|nr:nucleotidyltransferase domain-containing protein [Pseudomonadales bacterium]
MNLQPTIEVLQKWAANNVYIRKVFIYGSRARNDFTENSDLDVALVIRPALNDTNSMSVFSFEKQSWVNELQPKVPYKLHLKALHSDSPDVQSGIDRSSFLVYEEDNFPIQINGNSMERRDRIHSYLNSIALEVLDHIKEKEGQFPDRWVPAAEVKNQLDLNFVAVPQSNKQYGSKGWFFAIIARQLEDKKSIEYKKVGSRAYYRST